MNDTLVFVKRNLMPPNIAPYFPSPLILNSKQTVGLPSDVIAISTPDVFVMAKILFTTQQSVFVKSVG